MRKYVLFRKKLMVLLKNICSNKHISKYLFLNSYTFWNWNIQGMFSTPFDIFAKTIRSKSLLLFFKTTIQSCITNSYKYLMESFTTSCQTLYLRCMRATWLRLSYEILFPSFLIICCCKSARTVKEWIPFNTNPLLLYNKHLSIQ